MICLLIRSVPFRGSEEYDKIRIAVDKADKTTCCISFANWESCNEKSKSTVFMQISSDVQVISVIDNQGFDTVEEAVRSAT